MINLLSWRFSWVVVSSIFFSVSVLLQRWLVVFFLFFVFIFYFFVFWGLYLNSWLFLFLYTLSSSSSIIKWFRLQICFFSWDLKLRCFTFSLFSLWIFVSFWLSSFYWIRSSPYQWQVFFLYLLIMLVLNLRLSHGNLKNIGVLNQLWNWNFANPFSVLDSSMLFSVTRPLLFFSRKRFCALFFSHWVLFFCLIVLLF